MRGDSLRDFYAKSLALVGLAALAGVGAIVDYWPTDVRPSRVVAGGLPSPARALAASPADSDFIQTLTGRSRAFVVATARAVSPRQTAIVETTSPVPDPAPVPAPESLAVTTSTEIPAATPIDLAAPPAPEPLVLDVAPVDELQSPRVLLAGPAVQSSDDGSPVALVTGALRKTGQSIIRGGARTGESIKDAMRFVGGAFKRVPWF